MESSGCPTCSLPFVRHAFFFFFVLFVWRRQVHIGRYLARMIFAEHVRSADLFKEDDIVFE